MTRMKLMEGGSMGELIDGRASALGWSEKTNKWEGS